MMDEQKKICQYCKKRKNKKCTITDKYVARKKSCDTDPIQFAKKD